MSHTSPQPQLPQPNAQHPLARWLLLATVGTGVFLITLDNTVLYTALPTLVESLDATSSEMLWIINAYPVVIAGLLLGTGTLGDKIGHRRMFTIGMSIFGIASVVAAFAPSVALLIGGRALLALGAACMMPSTLSLIRLTFTKSRELSFAIGVWAMLAVVAGGVGPLVGGLLLEWFWWGSVFLLNVPFAVLSLIAIPFVAPRSIRDPEKHWDLLSSLQAMLALVCTVVVIKELAHSPQNWGLIFVALVLGACGWILFVRRQQRLTQPLLTLDIFRNPVFVAGTIGASFAMIGMVGLEFLVTQKFQLVDGFTPLQSGVLVTASAAGSALTSAVAGAKLHDIGARVLVSGGFLAASVGATLVAIGPVVDATWLIAVGLFIVGMGLGGVMSVASMLIISNAPAHRAGMASSVEEVSYEMGSLLAVAILGSVMSFVYTLRVNLPDGSPARANDSLQDAQLAIKDGSYAPELASNIMNAVTDSYLDAFVSSAVLVAVILFLGAAVTSRQLKGYVLPEDED